MSKRVWSFTIEMLMARATPTEQRIRCRVAIMLEALTQTRQPHVQHRSKSKRINILAEYKTHFI